MNYGIFHEGSALWGDFYMRKSGFTLMEIVVALCLLTIIVVGFLPVFISANALNTHSERNFDAQILAQRELELIMLRASNQSRDSIPDNVSDMLFENFSLASHDDLQGTVYLMYDVITEFDVYIETNFPNRPNAIRISIYDGDVLRYQAEDWIRYE